MKALAASRVVLALPAEVDAAVGAATATDHALLSIVVVVATAIEAPARAPPMREARV